MADAKDAVAQDKAAIERLTEYEDQEQAQLYARVVVVYSIKMMVPIVLDQSSPYYNRWCWFFLDMLSKYALDSLVLSDDDVSDNPYWFHMDCTVK